MGRAYRGSDPVPKDSQLAALIVKENDRQELTNLRIHLLDRTGQAALELASRIHWVSVRRSSAGGIADAPAPLRRWRNGPTRDRDWRCETAFHGR